jgi:transposase InsO family protein
MLPHDTLRCGQLNRPLHAGVIFLTDRGIEYATYAFRERLATLGFMQRWW